MSEHDSRKGSRWGLLRREGLASVVVFLIALPLSMGIAVACGVPPALGLITGIIGGILVGTLSGSPLQVSGPAAGLTVIVWELVQTHGLDVLGVVVLAAGVIQIAAGFLRLGKWFRAVSPAVIRGMLAGIGVLIVAAQFHVMFDVKPGSSGLPNLFAMPKTLLLAFNNVEGPLHFYAGATAATTLLLMMLWKLMKLDVKTHLPSPLIAIAGATTLAAFFGLPIAYINVPDSLSSVISFPTLTTFGELFERHVLLSAVSLALIASAETLLSAAAVDQMQHGPRAKYDKELVAQGVGNVACGALGALPLTGVIVRSSVNVEAGAKTRLSTIMHGFWLLAAVMAMPWLLRMVPVSALAALLVYTGFKLVDLKALRDLRVYGKTEILIYAVTISVIVVTDLLTGVLVGLLLSLTKLVLKLCQMEAEVKAGTPPVLVLRGTATFLALPKLTQVLEAIPDGTKLKLDAQYLAYIDHACVETLQQWHVRQTAKGGGLDADWQDLLQRYKTPADTTKEVI